jgi:hypothetical protein
MAIYSDIRGQPKTNILIDAPIVEDVTTSSNSYTNVGTWVTRLLPTKRIVFTSSSSEPYYAVIYGEGTNTGIRLDSNVGTGVTVVVTYNWINPSYINNFTVNSKAVILNIGSDYTANDIIAWINAQPTIAAVFTASLALDSDGTGYITSAVGETELDSMDVADLKFKILGSLDNGSTFPHTVESEFTVVVGSPVIKTIFSHWDALKIQVKPAINDVHGTSKITASGASFAIFNEAVEATVSPLTYISGSKASTVGQAATLTIPSGAKKVIFSVAGDDDSAFVNIDAAATSSTRFKINGWKDTSLDINGASSLSIWVVAGAVNYGFWG